MRVTIQNKNAKVRSSSFLVQLKLIVTNTIDESLCLQGNTPNNHNHIILCVNKNNN